MSSVTIIGLTKAQCDLEAAIGALRAAAISHATVKADGVAIELFQLAEQGKRLRDPAVVSFLDRRRLRAAQQQAGVSA